LSIAPVFDITGTLPGMVLIHHLSDKPGYPGCSMRRGQRTVLFRGLEKKMLHEKKGAV
jgi:hypothetical protein